MKRGGTGSKAFKLVIGLASGAAAIWLAVALGAAAEPQDAIASGFAKLRGAETPPAATTDIEGGFAAVTRQRELEARVVVERNKYLAVSAGICQGQMQAIATCNARNTCGAPATPPGYSEGACRTIPSRPYSPLGAVLTSSSCDAACQDEISARRSEERRALAAAEALWDAQWASLSATCQAVAAQRKPFEACLQAQAKICNPGNVSQQSCVADRATRQPSVDAVRALMAQETSRSLGGATTQGRGGPSTTAGYLDSSAAVREAAMAKAADEAAREAARKRVVEQTAARAAARAEDAAAERKYLEAVRAGTTLSARKCPDGEGRYYVVGIRPKISPQVVACVDLHYRAQCAGSRSFSSGVGNNFSGISTSCYIGDTYKIDPTPPCPIEQVTVTAVKVTACTFDKSE